jgi:hypothetical protein
MAISIIFTPSHQFEFEWFKPLKPLKPFEDMMKPMKSLIPMAPIMQNQVASDDNSFSSIQITSNGHNAVHMQRTSNGGFMSSSSSSSSSSSFGRK